jgi:type I restriction enzyme S subunit
MLKFKWEKEFKETEIGEIPKDWKVRNLGDNRFFKILPSGIKKFEGFKEYLSTSSVEGNEIVKIEELITYNKRPSRANMQPVENSVWLARMINSPKFLKANKDLIENKILSTGFLGIQTKEKEICDYLFYYIQTKEFQECKDAYVTGAVQESLTNENAKELLVIFPPLPEQTRIANVLSYFDNLIENKKRQNEILEKTAMAIFKNWFVDFEPFKNGKFVYNEELGKEIPKGWEVKKLGEVVKTQYGITISGENFGEIKLLRITDINKTFVIDWDNVPYCNLHEKIFYKYNLSDKDIVISRIADIGKVAIIEDPPKSVFASYLIRLKIKSDSNIKPYYLYYWLKSEIYQEYILGSGEGSTRENTNAEVIKDGPILIPDISILQKFEELACDLRSKIILNQKQIMTLRKIRDTLLPLLVFGKLRVEEI